MSVMGCFLFFFCQLLFHWPSFWNYSRFGQVHKRDNWNQFFRIGCPSCCWTNSFKALKELETLTPTEEKSPARVIFSWSSKWHPTKRDAASFTFTPDLHPQNFWLNITFRPELAKGELLALGLKIHGYVREINDQLSVSVGTACVLTISQSEHIYIVL